MAGWGHSNFTGSSHCILSLFSGPDGIMVFSNHLLPNYSGAVVGGKSGDSAPHQLRSTVLSVSAGRH